jgi:hypothetical protein
VSPRSQISCAPPGLASELLHFRHRVQEARRTVRPAQRRLQAAIHIVVRTWSESAVTMYSLGPCCISTKTLRMSSIFSFKVDNQIVRTIAGALPVASRRAGHLVVIARLNALTKSLALGLYAANRRSPSNFCAPDTLMRTSSKQEAKPMMRFASPCPMTIACARYRSTAAVAIVPAQHVNAAVSHILIMTPTAPTHIKRGRRFVIASSNRIRQYSRRIELFSLSS